MYQRPPTKHSTPLKMMVRVIIDERNEKEACFLNICTWMLLDQIIDESVKVVNYEKHEFSCAYCLTFERMI